MPETKKLLITKLSDIMQSVERIPKNGWNDFHKYKYATEADVADHCRKLIADHHIIMTTDVESAEIINMESTDKIGAIKSTPITRLRMRFRFYDGDSDATISFAMYADGQDSLDKGCYKAITGGVKYALMKTFLIPTGDDPERDEPQSKAKAATKISPEQLPNDRDENPPATEAQRKKLYAVMKDAKVPDPDIKGLLSAIAGRPIQTSGELTKRDASNAIDIISTPAKLKKYYPPAQPAAPQTDEPQTPDYTDDEIPF